MSTITTFYVNHADVEKIAEKIKQLSFIQKAKVGSYPADHYNAYLMDENELPDYLLIGLTQSAWVTVHHNTSNKLTEWGHKISKELACKVIVTIAQTVTDYYYFALYDLGEKQREIEVCYSEDFVPVNFGERFEFENEEPGELVEFDGESSFVFDLDSIQRYCEYFELDVVAENSKIEWIILKGEQTKQMRNTVAEKKAGNPKKAWWKIW